MGKFLVQSYLFTLRHFELGLGVDCDDDVTTKGSSHKKGINSSSANASIKNVLKSWFNRSSVLNSNQTNQYASTPARVRKKMRNLFVKVCGDVQ